MIALKDGHGHMCLVCLQMYPCDVLHGAAVTALAYKPECLLCELKRRGWVK